LLLFTFIASTNVIYDRATAVAYVTPIGNEDVLLLIFNS